MDILKIQNNKVIFEGFRLINSDKITVKEFNHSIVIVPGELKETERHHIFLLDHHCSSSPALLALIKKYCKKENTVFMEMDGVYYQLEQV